MTDRLEEIRNLLKENEKCGHWEASAGSCFECQKIYRKLKESVPYLLSELEKAKAESALRLSALELACEHICDTDMYAADRKDSVTAPKCWLGKAKKVKA